MKILDCGQSAGKTRKVYKLLKNEKNMAKQPYHMRRSDLIPVIGIKYFARTLKFADTQTEQEKQQIFLTERVLYMGFYQATTSLVSGFVIGSIIKGLESFIN